MNEEDKIPLAKMIGQLRAELLEAQRQGEGTDLRFLIEDVDIELQLATTQEGEGGFGIRFWVLDANAGGRGSEVLTQRVRLKLAAVDAEGKPIKIRSEATRRPD